MERSVSPLWSRELADPSACRPPKPRQRGLTMVLDKGMGLAQFADWLQTVGDHVDIVKLGFGTAALYPIDVLQRKIRLAAERGVQITPGGTFFEVAFVRRRAGDYLDQVARLGFTAVEISEGTVSLPRAERTRWIREALARGLIVYTEYGKKNGAPLSPFALVETAQADLEAGARAVLIEGRESGRGVGLYDPDGQLREDLLHDVLTLLADIGTDNVIWEAPKKDQQVTFLRALGPHVNLGNVAPSDAMALEAMRRGLRGDTLPFYLEPH
ncbi:phosphosulfolactate synthase [Calditerricola yamamurae]